MKKALVLSLLFVLGLGFAAFAQGELTGAWSTTITINPEGEVPDANDDPLDDFFSFASDLTITYSVGGWDFTSITSVDSTGWAAQDFAIAGVMGAFDLSGGMKVSPLGDEADFPQWIFLDTAFTFGSVGIGFDFDLYGKDIRLCLTGDATTGLVDISVELCFGDLYIQPVYGYPIDETVGYNYPDFGYYGNVAAGAHYAAVDWAVYDNDLCDLDWMGVNVTVEFPFCCADVTATLSINCDGFQMACFSVDGIVVSNIPWFTLGAEVCFELESKTLVLTPAFDFGADICFDVYISTDADPYVTAPMEVLALPNISIVGLGIDCEIGGVSFSGLSYWKPDVLNSKKPGILKYTPYWEAYRIATTEDACCGPFDFDVTIYFDLASTFLFDVAAFAANFSYELGDNFTFSMGLDYTAADGLTLWNIGFEITW
jgi:hypothetical protein